MEFFGKVLEAVGVVTGEQLQNEAVEESAEVTPTCSQVLGGGLGSPGQEASSSRIMPITT